MGLALARIGHTLSSPKVVVPAAVAGGGALATATIVGAQWGWGADFSKAETPNGNLLFAGTVASGIGGIVSLANHKAGHLAGPIGFGASLGSLGALWIGVPVARRALAES